MGEGLAVEAVPQFRTVCKVGSESLDGIDAIEARVPGEATAGSGGFLQPAIYGVSGNSADSGNRGFVYALDAHSRDFIEHSAPMLESMIDSSAVPAEGPAASLAT